MKTALGKKVLIPVGVLLLAALFLGLNAYRNQKENGSREVKTAVVTRGQLAFSVLANGLVEPGQKAEIRAKLAGTVDSVLVAEGDQVSKGQKLAVFLQSDLLNRAIKLEAAIAQAKAQERQLKTRAKYWQDQVKYQLAQSEAQVASALLGLEKTKTGNEDQVAATQRDLQNAQLTYDLLKTQLEDSKVTEKDLEAARKNYDAARAAVRENSRDGLTPLSGYTYHQAQASLLKAEEDLRRAEAKYAEQNDEIAKKLEQSQLQMNAAADRLKSLTSSGTSRDLAAAENQVKAAQAAFELAKVNTELSKVTPDDISSAEAAVRSAEADYQRTQEELEDSVIASPIDGKVIVAEVKAGEGVTPGLQLFTLGRTEQVLVKAKVDEVDIGKVALDQPVEVNSSAYLGKSFTGKISKIAPRAVKDGNINVFEVEVLVENPDGALRPGMSVDVTITAEQKKDALLVPAEAVIERNGSKLVFALENGVARQRQVKTGATNRTTVEILDGLKDGDQVVVGPAEVLKSLKEGDRVKSAEAKKDAGNTKKEGGKP